MQRPERTQLSRLTDFIWRIVLRVGFRLARIWWHVRRPSHEGALVAIYVGQALLLVKSSYRSEWGLPGGSIHPGEAPDTAARREMQEELGFSSNALRSVGSVSGVWDGRRDRVHFFELRLDSAPDLRLDNREIIATRLASPEELSGIALTAAVAAYLGADSRA
ncbi:NUDIX domain-containing protein [Trinickia sp.]|uniref:NUDIX domain-containing protein n=1 Tax=Trinickia sp. TaxID=2571163 RepID=UPI003F7ED1F9